MAVAQNQYGSADGMSPYGFDSAETSSLLGDGGFGQDTKPSSMYVKSPFDIQQRRRLNVVPMLLCLFAPWLMFVGVTGVLSFNMKYYQPLVSWLFVAFGFLLVIFSGALAVYAQKKKIMMDPSATPVWYTFLFATMCIAFLLGVVMGMYNYNTYTMPYLSTLSMDTASGIDPGRTKGEEMLDVSRLVFVNETRLDITRSMGFKDDTVYCVAPIINPDTVKSDRYDFWAVGTDCCSGHQADFRCDGFNDPWAHSGLRLMQDSDRAFYRMAVQQAEATFHIGAPYPLFFTWVVDVDKETNALAESCMRNFVSTMFAYFILQGFFVTVATLAFSKMSFHYGYH